ncbi:DNA polymerase [Enterovibrio norvegicus]|uniref:DNA polymerase n=1 Tax=Enterovibrio norvegicus TaxID=188144 RepID=UPI0015E3A250|nr:DNA polymerase [Enterovibrio norvegicus]
MNPLLSRPSGKTYSVATSTKFSRSHNNYGFNFSTTGTNECIYYHAPKVKHLPHGKYFVCYEASSLVEGRQDAIVVFRETEFQDFVAEQLEQVALSEECKNLLNSHPELRKQAVAILQRLVQVLLVREDQTRLTTVLEIANQLNVTTASVIPDLYQGKFTTLVEYEKRVVKSGLSNHLIPELKERAAKILFQHFSDLESAIVANQSVGVLTSEIRALAAEVLLTTPRSAALLSRESLGLVVSSKAFEPTFEQFEQLFAVLDRERAQVIAKYLPVDTIYQLLLRFEESGIADLVKCFDAKLVETLLDDKLVQQISKNYGVFLNYFDNGHAALCEHFPLEDFLRFADYSSEARFIQFLMQFGHGCSGEELAFLNKAATQNDFHEALLLIALLEQKVIRGGASVQSITALFDNFQKGLFEHHAKSRTKIELSILAVCQWLKKEQVMSGDRFCKRSVCEGKLWFAKIKDEKGDDTGEKEPKALCRRNDCTMCVFDGMENIDPFKGKSFQRQYVSLPRDLTFTGHPFYTMVRQLFGITAENLHQHDAFVRMLSAINRWNEILEKLICRQCDNPLQIAEHGKGSIGYLAVGTTYWHCGSDRCATYGESVKISYCIGCQKYIDSRDDKKSCTPYEIRSYKKFYICNDCGSCCSKHNGFAGICPYCGKDGVFNDIHQAGRTRAKCKHCDEVTNIGHFAFQALAQHKVEGGAFSQIRSLSEKPSHLAGSVVDNMGNTHWLVSDTPWNNPVLYIYDLYESLRANKITRQMLSKYHEVYDLKVIESLALLGLNHSRYGVQKVKPTLEQLFEESSDNGGLQQNQNAIFDLVRHYFKTLHDTDMWSHYNNVEHKFITALHALSEQGLNISESVLKDELAKLERSRNQYVQKLNALKVFDVDKPSLINYLTDKFTSNEAELLITQLERHGAKPIRSIDHSFEYLHGIEKTERAARIVQKLLALPRNVTPKYQVVGTSTSRCTSRSPNLMNLPKESRHILKAGYGTSIIECDYKQMEIGVLAALSGDKQLISDFNTGDVYEKFGAVLTITRAQAKVILLGLIYGMSAATIATQLGVTKVIAEAYIQGFFTRYPDVKKYQDELVAQGTKQGYVTSCTGLRRTVNRQVVKSSAILNWEQNWFKNFPVQSSASSVFKLSIVELARELHGEQFKLLVPHYDAIVFEVPEAQASHYTEQVKAAMHRAMKKQFPMLDPQIDVKSCGQSWGEQAQEMDSSSPYQPKGIEDLPF